MPRNNDAAASQTASNVDWLNKKFVSGEINLSQNTYLNNCDPNDGIIIGDLWGYITDVNDVALKLVGASDKKEFAGKHVLNFVVKEERTRVVQESLNSIANNQERIERCRVLALNGEVIPVEINVHFLRDQNGQAIGFIDLIRKTK